MKQRAATYYHFLLLVLIVSFFVAKISVAQTYSNTEKAAATEINLSALDWKLWGYRIDSWRKNFDFQKLQGDRAEIMNIPVHIPGSVQKALKDASLISDWNIGTNSVESEWVENRH